MTSCKPVICIVGNLIGRNPGHVTTQGLILANRLVDDGFTVFEVSSKMNRLARLVEILWTILRNSRKTDIIIVEVYSGFGFLLADAASLISKLLFVRTILVLHGGNLPEFAKRRPRWFSRVMSRASALVAPSEFLAEAMRSEGYEVCVVPNVIDLGLYDFKLRNRTSPRLIWMRSFHKIYNPQLALDVLSIVMKRHPDAILVMAGVDKGLENTVKESASEMGLRERVSFPGFLDDKAKTKEFSKADIYLNTNRIDNMPVSVVEACAMGLPVVATDVGGLSKLITHGENGLLVPDDDASAMADAVIRLLNEPDTAERLSRNGRILAEKSSWKNVRVLWEELFDELLAERNDRVAGRSGGQAEQVER